MPRKLRVHERLSPEDFCYAPQPLAHVHKADCQSRAVRYGERIAPEHSPRQLYLGLLYCHLCIRPIPDLFDRYMLLGIVEQYDRGWSRVTYSVGVLLRQRRLLRLVSYPRRPPAPARRAAANRAPVPIRVARSRTPEETAARLAGMKIRNAPTVAHLRAAKITNFHTWDVN